MELYEILAEFYERDLRRLIEEIKLFKNEADLWKTWGEVTNSAGNLTLHLVGGMNHHIGARLGNTGYVRDRDLEFSQKDVPGERLIVMVEKLIETIKTILANITTSEMEAEFPAFFDKPGTSVQYVLIQLTLHLNYHLGQVNYLRRLLN